MHKTINGSSWGWKPKKTIRPWFGPYAKAFAPQLLAAAAILILVTASVTNAIVGTAQRQQVAELQDKNEQQAVEIHQQGNDLSRLAAITEKADALQVAVSEYVTLYTETFSTGKTDKEIEANIAKLVEKRNQVNKAIAEYETAKQ